MDKKDKNGNSLEDYPERINSSRLLGINGFGIAEYYDGEEIYFALLEEGYLQVPPTDYGHAHELVLDVMGWSLVEYIRQNALEGAGPWRVLTDFAKYELRTKGLEPENFTE